MALPCSHAFHRECLQQWLQQCYGQARSATCPMCQLSIPLRVRYRMPWHPHGQQAGGEEGGGGQQAAAEGIPGLAALAMVLQVCWVLVLCWPGKRGCKGCTDLEITNV